MKQLEIQYFFPLTEQLELDLDFSQCSPHQYWYRAQGIAGVHGPFPTGMKYIEAGTGLTSVETLISIKKEPNIFEKIYNWMGK